MSNHDDTNPPDGDDPYDALHDEAEAEMLEDIEPPDEETEAQPPARREPEGQTPRRGSVGSVIGTVMREVGRALVTELQKSIDEAGSGAEAEIIELERKSPDPADYDEHDDDEDEEGEEAEVIDLDAERQKRGVSRYGVTLGEATRDALARFLKERGTPVSQEGDTMHFEMDSAFLRQHGRELLTYLMQNVARNVDPSTLSPRSDDPAEVHVELEIGKLLEDLSDPDDQ